MFEIAYHKFNPKYEQVYHCNLVMNAAQELQLFLLIHILPAVQDHKQMEMGILHHANIDFSKSPTWHLDR